MIPFLDLKSATQELRSELDEAYHRFMDSGWFVLGEEVNAFEREYAEYCESQFCVGVGTGLDALTLALRSIDVGPGDEVIVPSNTYIATWLAVTQVGATIVPVEPDINTYNIDADLVAAAVTRRTKVILPVNLYGQPVDYDAILSIAADANAKVIVDNAQAQGARYKNRAVGGLAHLECHSFYPSKNLGAFGEAGAITTNDEALAERLRSLRNYGSKLRYHHLECGTNSRLDALQAALLRVKLRHLNEWNSRRKEIAKTYLEQLSNLAAFKLPCVPERSDPVWHLFVVTCLNRQAIRARLDAHAIQSQIHYPIPPHLSVAYQHLGMQRGSFPIAEQMADSILSLPIGPHLEASSTQELVQVMRGAPAT